MLIVLPPHKICTNNFVEHRNENTCSTLLSISHTFLNSPCLTPSIHWLIFKWCWPDMLKRVSYSMYSTVKSMWPIEVYNDLASPPFSVDTSPFSPGVKKINITNNVLKEDTHRTQTRVFWQQHLCLFSALCTLRQSECITTVTRMLSVAMKLSRAFSYRLLGYYTYANVNSCIFNHIPFVSVPT